MKELLNMPSVRHNDLKGMRSLIDHLTAHTRALNTLGVSTDSFSSLLLPVVKDKLPEDWRLEWARRDSGDFAEFLQFLSREIRLRESARGATAPTASDAVLSAPSATSSLTARRETRSDNSKAHLNPTRMTCSACGQGHLNLEQCGKFRNMEVEGRWRVARNSMACFRCLGSGHRARHCKGKQCVQCGRQHHLLLHNPGLMPPAPPESTSRLSPVALHSRKRRVPRKKCVQMPESVSRRFKSITVITIEPRMNTETSSKPQ